MALADVRSALDALNHPTEAALAAGADDLCALLDRLRRVGLRIDERVDVDIVDARPRHETRLFTGSRRNRSPT